MSTHLRGIAIGIGYFLVYQAFLFGIIFLGQIFV